MTKVSAVEAMRLVALTQFKPFTDADWDAFIGCESENPLIGENGEYVLVLDGETINILPAVGWYGGQLFSLSEI